MESLGKSPRASTPLININSSRPIVKARRRRPCHVRPPSPKPKQAPFSFHQKNPGSNSDSGTSDSESDSDSDLDSDSDSQVSIDLDTSPIFTGKNPLKKSTKNLPASSKSCRKSRNKSRRKLKSPSESTRNIQQSSNNNSSDSSESYSNQKRGSKSKGSKNQKKNSGDDDGEIDTVAVLYGLSSMSNHRHPLTGLVDGHENNTDWDDELNPYEMPSIRYRRRRRLSPSRTSADRNKNSHRGFLSRHKPFTLQRKSPPPPDEGTNHQNQQRAHCTLDIDVDIDVGIMSDVDVDIDVEQGPPEEQIQNHNQSRRIIRTSNFSDEEEIIHVNGQSIRRNDYYDQALSQFEMAIDRERNVYLHDYIIDCIVDGFLLLKNCVVLSFSHAYFSCRRFGHFVLNLSSSWSNHNNNKDKNNDGNDEENGHNKRGGRGDSSLAICELGNSNNNDSVNNSCSSSLDYSTSSSSSSCEDEEGEFRHDQERRIKKEHLW